MQICNFFRMHISMCSIRSIPCLLESNTHDHGKRISFLCHLSIIVSVLTGAFTYSTVIYDVVSGMLILIAGVITSEITFFPQNKCIKIYLVTMKNIDSHDLSRQDVSLLYKSVTNASRVMAVMKDRNAIKGFFQTALLPFIIVLRITGCYSNWNNIVADGNCITRLFGIAQLFWSYSFFFMSSTYSVIIVKNTLNRQSCRTGEIIHLISVIGGHTIKQFSKLLFILYMHNIIDCEFRKISDTTAKHFIRKDRVFLKTVVFSMAVFIAICTYLTSGDIGSAYDACMSSALFDDLNHHNRILVAWVLCVVDSISHLGRRCSQLLVSFICICLAVCLKRINEELQFVENKKSPISNDQRRAIVKVALAEHTALCDLINEVDKKISFLLLVLFLKDVLVILQLISDLRSTGVSSFTSAKVIGFTVPFIFFALKTSALVYLSDQVGRNLITFYQLGNSTGCGEKFCTNFVELIEETPAR